MDQPMIWIELKTIAVIFVLLLIPGWALLSFNHYWKKWEPLQRWALALSLGVAFYPVLYYLARFLVPGLRIGAAKLILLLVVSSAVLLWNLRGHWKDQIKIGKYGWIVLGILAGTLFTRLILAHQYPYLTLGDPLHHTLLTELVATTGKLPESLLPYESARLDQYHLGLYALTAPLKLLAGIPSDTALLWMCQFLNGLSGLGIFLILDKKVSRQAAIVGMVAAGLLYIFPAWYINWGRFTQLAAQTILLQAVIVTWEGITWFQTEDKKKFSDEIIPVLLAVLLNAGVCLLHFRVAGFMIPLTVLVCIFGLSHYWKETRKRRVVFLRAVAVGALTLLIILPTLIQGLQVYIDQRTAVGPNASVPLSERPSYAIRSDDFGVNATLDAKPILLLSAAGLLVGLLYKKTRPVSLIILFWFIFLMLEGFSFLLNNRLIAFTNLSAILISFYLLIGIGLGILAEVVLRLTADKLRYDSTGVIFFIVLLTGFIASFDRVNALIPDLILMTPEDEKAMEWVRQNTPEDALFAVPTVIPRPSLLLGTDAGYWLPFYGERQTTSRTYLSSFSDDFDLAYERAQAVQLLYGTEPDLSAVCRYGVDYIYSGVKIPNNWIDFDMQKIASLPGVLSVYDQDGVQILSICN